MGTSSSFIYDTLTIDAFVRAVEINKETPHSLFLGAGASITSGVPSASACIWEWKRSIFLSNNPGLENYYSELSLGSVRQEIQKWLNLQGGYPTENSDEEYSTYVELCHPISTDRGRYFQRLCRGKEPFVGYKFFSLLAQSRLMRAAWTTNFDGFINRSLFGTGLDVIEATLDATRRVTRPLHDHEILVVSLHGDYKYDQLKNTSGELKSQEARFEDDLIHRLKHMHLIVCGYSGRDHSVMEALRQAYSSEGSGRLYWCGYSSSDVALPVQELLSIAKQNGREAFYVSCDGFDDVMRRLALKCLDGDLSEQARAINETRPQKVESEPFTLQLGEKLEILRSNAFAIECPDTVWQFSAKNFDDDVWEHVRTLVDGRDVVAVPVGGEIYALGELEQIKRVFENHIAGDIKKGMITALDLSKIKGPMIDLFLRAITQSLAYSWELGSDGKGLLWDKNPFEYCDVSGQEYSVHAAVLLALRRYAGKQYLVLKPTVVCNDSAGEKPDREIIKTIKDKFLKTQRNKQFAEEIDGWRGFLFQDYETFYFPAGREDGATFTVRNRHALALIHQPPQLPGEPSQKKISFEARVMRGVRSNGVRIHEPQLAFTALDKSSQILRPAYESNPMKGIVLHRPFDFELTQNGLKPTVRIGVISPTTGKQALNQFLQTFHSKVASPPKNEYVLDFSGFNKAFGLPLLIPQLGDEQWKFYQVPSSSGDAIKDAELLRRNIVRAIDLLREETEVDVVIIYIPTSCEDMTRVKFDGGDFDLRRQIKAFCIEREIPSQIIRDKTVFGEFSQRCQTLWWLSLALYVKAGRIPWTLHDYDRETAFAGLGFSQEHGGFRGKHITIGCSHIYNSQGLDLKYKLSGLENVSWRKENPFLSRDDARRVGEDIRELFYAASNRLPYRVVLHKRTPFGEEEKQGLLEGLREVEEVDLLEITHEPHLRFTTNKSLDGRLTSADFPVNRDTVIQLDDTRALLWIHGNVPNINSGRNYFMGGYRIPSPIAVRRAYGKAPLAAISSELLGLSKMNWNSFNLYTKAPATIESSNDIAKIGALLSRFGSISYDYRLFM